jgi:sulfur-oxidizing protein SoxX
MRPANLMILIISAAGFIGGCQPKPESGSGFRLPDGDPEAGRQAFLAMQCNACHQIEGIEMPNLDLAAPVTVVLGGQVSRVKTYGDLVTSIINPSHKLISTYPADEVSVDGETFMPTMNQFMTVDQLIDIVAFLQIQYDVVPPTAYPYSVYSYP